jgi:hypothetical protein
MYVHVFWRKLWKVNPVCNLVIRFENKQPRVNEYILWWSATLMFLHHLESIDTYTDNTHGLYELVYYLFQLGALRIQNLKRMHVCIWVWTTPFQPPFSSACTLENEHYTASKTNSIWNFLFITQSTLIHKAIQELFHFSIYHTTQ